MSYPVWVNGEEGGLLLSSDRGLAYGDGLFETLRIESQRAVFADAHFSRLFSSAAVLGIALSQSELIADFSRFLSVCPERGVAKIVVTRGRGGRGYLPDPQARPTVIFSAHPLPVYPDSFPVDGIVADISGLRLGLQPMLAGHKHLNRLEQVMLRREQAMLSADEMLVCGQDGHVVEGVASNVFLVKGGQLGTPLIDKAGICGVMRGQIMEQAARLRITVIESRYAADDFLLADEVFFCNSVNGIWPVRCLPGRQWQPGPLTRQLQSFWQEALGF
ncbi:MAG: aminodeoxychorismate lyase [Moraxellaceae bacterium]